MTNSKERIFRIWSFLSMKIGWMDDYITKCFHGVWWALGDLFIRLSSFVFCTSSCKFITRILVRFQCFLLISSQTVSLFLDKKSKLVHNRQSAPKLQVISIGQFELILLSACLPYFAKTHSMFFIQQIKQKTFWDIIRET